MSVLPVGFGSSGGSSIDTGDIPASLRFRGAQYLSKTITTDATSTYFAAVKRGKLGVISPIFDTNIKFNANDTLTAFGLTTTAVFRDPTSWLFIHVSNGGLYINGVSFGAVTTSALTNPRIGFDGTNYFDGYIARIGCVAGSSSAYTNFGELNTDINEWVSKSQSEVKAVVDAGGTNSFMLDFDDPNFATYNVGKDFSSKGNNWNPTGFNVTTNNTTYDHMLDVPGNSYATLNPLNVSTYSTLSNGNLRATGNTATNSGLRCSTFPATTGKIVWEQTVTTTSGNYPELGCISLIPNDGNGINPATSTTLGIRYRATGEIYKNSNSLVGTFSTLSAGNVVRFELDVDALTCAIYRNNTLVTTVTGLTAGVFYPAVSDYNGSVTDTNLGQQPWANTPNTGFLALCQANLEEPAILNPEDHHVDIAVTKSGDTNFTLPWDADVYDTFFEIKRRNSTGDWYQIDGLRGYTKILKSNSTAAETTDANVLGISGTTGTLKSTLADGTYIVSATKAGLSASRQTNTDGSITSTVSRNVDSGFAIVSCTGTAANATVGHGLGVALNQIVAKALGSATGWPVYHSKLANTEYLVLNTTAAKATGATYWNSTSPTSTVFSLGSSTNTNNTGGMIFYCYADSAIQKSFSYTGNGSADGPNPNLGFKCGRSLVKNSSDGTDWMLFDAARNTYNATNLYIQPNNTTAEASGIGDGLDITANSLKLRSTNVTVNGSTNTHIGHAWAAVTGKYSLSR